MFGTHFSFVKCETNIFSPTRMNNTVVIDVSDYTYAHRSRVCGSGRR